MSKHFSQISASMRTYSRRYWIYNFFFSFVGTISMSSYFFNSSESLLVYLKCYLDGAFEESNFKLKHLFAFKIRKIVILFKYYLMCKRVGILNNCQNANSLLWLHTIQLKCVKHKIYFFFQTE